MCKKISICLTAVLLLFLTMPAAAYVDTDYAIDSSGEKQAIPVTYTCQTVYRNFGGDVGFLNMPEDLFIDEQGVLYIADTGNSRIVRFDPATGEATAITGPSDSPLYDPKGVYIDAGGDLFVADTGNGRIAHLDPEGGLVEQFVKPTSELLDEEEAFAPDKIYVNDMNRLYVKQGKQFLIINPENGFEGYAGAPEVDFSFTQLLIDLFASEDQKGQLETREPAQYSNFLIHDGLLYATSLAESGQLRKISATDKNIYPEKVYGEIRVGEDELPLFPQFVDLAVNSQGIVFAIDQTNGQLYQYDQEGNLLAVFGSLGSLKGTFQAPMSIAVDPAGQVYVLDGIQNAVHVFQPTAFMQKVHRALALYYNGEYDAAAALWEEVRLTDTNYYMANSGIGNTLYKSGEYREALTYFEEANDRAGYSKAYAKYLQELAKAHFLWILVGIVVLVAGIWVLILWWRRVADRFLASSYGFDANERRGLR